MNVVIKCPACQGVYNPNRVCGTCDRNGFLVAKLWSEADQKRHIAAKEAHDAETKRRKEAHLAREERRNPQTHWNDEPLPEGWTTRRSTRGGLLPFRGNVRLIGSGRYRVEVLDKDAKTWVPHRVASKTTGRTRIYQTRVRSRAYETANSLYVPTPEENAKETSEEALKTWVEAQAAELKKFPHPSAWHTDKSLYDWSLWILSNRPSDMDRVRSKVESALKVPVPILGPTPTPSAPSASLEN